MRRALLASLAVTALMASTAAAADNPPGHQMAVSTYSVIGDTPYSTFQIQHFPQDIAEINADPDVTRVVHVGDIKSGSTVEPAPVREPGHGREPRLLAREAQA